MTKEEIGNSSGGVSARRCALEGGKEELRQLILVRLCSIKGFCRGSIV